MKHPLHATAAAVIGGLLALAALASAQPYLAALLAVACVLPVAVYRLRRASRQVDAILQDLEDTTPAPTTPAPKETTTP